MKPTCMLYWNLTIPCVWFDCYGTERDSILVWVHYYGNITITPDTIKYCTVESCCDVQDIICVDCLYYLEAWGDPC